MTAFSNGCIERFFRTLKENLLWVRDFETIEELRLALLEFRRLYNEHWILERHGYLTPSHGARRACDSTGPGGVNTLNWLSKEPGVDTDFDVAQSLKDAGCLSVTDFKIIQEQQLKNG